MSSVVSEEAGHSVAVGSPYNEGALHGRGHYHHLPGTKSGTLSNVSLLRMARPPFLPLCFFVLWRSRKRSRGLGVRKKKEQSKGQEMWAEATKEEIGLIVWTITPKWPFWFAAWEWYIIWLALKLVTIMWLPSSPLAGKKLDPSPANVKTSW